MTRTLQQMADEPRGTVAWVTDKLWLQTYAAAFAREWSQSRVRDLSTFRASQGLEGVDCWAAVRAECRQVAVRTADEAVKAMEESDG